MSDDDLMPFGKHRGERMDAVPAGYLLWLWNAGLHKDDTRWMNQSQIAVAGYIRKNFHALETECPDTIVEHRPL